jgi:hypothetical protein
MNIPLKNLIFAFDGKEAKKQIDANIQKHKNDQTEPLI